MIWLLGVLLLLYAVARILFARWPWRPFDHPDKW